MAASRAAKLKDLLGERIHLRSTIWRDTRDLLAEEDLDPADLA
jgi:hypothetical protein